MRKWTKVRIRFKITIESFLVAACYLLILNLLLYAFWQINIPKNLLRICAVVMCGLVYVLQSKLRMIDCIYILIAVYLIAVRGLVSINLAFMVILAVALGQMEQKRLLQALNKVHGVLVAAVAVSLVLGVVHNETLQVAMRTRNTLGFVHVNYVGLLGYSLFSVYLMSRQEVRFRNLVWTAAACLVLFLLTDSRTGFMGVAVLLLLFWVFCGLPLKWSKLIARTVLLFAFLSPFVWQVPFVNSGALNSLLSNRPMLFTEYIQSNTLLHLVVGGSRVKEVDSFYLLLLYNAGIVIYGLVACVSTKAVLSLLDREMRIEAAFVVATLVVALFESSLLRPEIPCMCFFWRLVLMNRDPVFFNRRSNGTRLVNDKR